MNHQEKAALERTESIHIVWSLTLFVLVQFILIKTEPMDLSVGILGIITTFSFWWRVALVAFAMAIIEFLIGKVRAMICGLFLILFI